MHSNKEFAADKDVSSFTFPEATTHNFIPLFNFFGDFIKVVLFFYWKKKNISYKPKSLSYECKMFIKDSLITANSNATNLFKLSFSIFN